MSASARYGEDQRKQDRDAHTARSATTVPASLPCSGCLLLARVAPENLASASALLATQAPLLSGNAPRLERCVEQLVERDHHRLTKAGDTGCARCRLCGVFGAVRRCRFNCLPPVTVPRTSGRSGASNGRGDWI